jgi:hypothetical protein
LSAVIINNNEIVETFEERTHMEDIIKKWKYLPSFIDIISLTYSQAFEQQLLFL